MKSSDMENLDQETNQPSEDELDRVLDAALAKYASVEPRTGLEDRILANMQSAEAPVSQATWWYWSLAMALAALLIAFAIGLKSFRSHGTNARQNTVPTQATPPQGDSRKLARDIGASGQTPIHLASTHVPRHNTAAPKYPKLDQFPSPHPLSEQEQMLARFVAQFNDEAVIVARVRTEAMRLDREKEMQEAEQSGNQNLRTR